MPYQHIDYSHVESAELKKILLHSDMMLHDLYQIFSIPAEKTKHGGSGNFTIAVILLCIVDGLAVYLYPTRLLVDDQERRFKQLLREKLYWGPPKKGWIESGLAAKQFYLELRNLLVHELGADRWTSGRIKNHLEPHIGKWGSIPEGSRDIDKIQDMSSWNDDWPILGMENDEQGEQYVQFSGAAMWWAVKKMIVDLINDTSIIQEASANAQNELK